MLNHTQSPSKSLAATYRARRAAIIAARPVKRMSAGAFARATAEGSQAFIRGTR